MKNFHWYVDVPFLPAMIFIGDDGSFEYQLVMWFFLIPVFLVDIVQMSFVISDSM